MGVGVGVGVGVGLGVVTTPFPPPPHAASTAVDESIINVLRRETKDAGQS